MISPWKLGELPVTVLLHENKDVLFAQHKDVTKVKASKEQKNLLEYHQKALLLVSQHNCRFRCPLWCINHGQQ